MLHEIMWHAGKQYTNEIYETNEKTGRVETPNTYSSSNALYGQGEDMLKISKIYTPIGMDIEISVINRVDDIEIIDTIYTHDLEGLGILYAILHEIKAGNKTINEREIDCIEISSL